MEHRGPDGAGLWPPRGAQLPHAVLGHRRLSIVDHSEAGAQPLVVSEGDRTLGVLVYNGELYNASELRARLAAARTWRGAPAHAMPRSDTWVLAHLLAAEGESVLVSVRGMFALAWLDCARGELVLARDPLGVKPLLYAQAQARSEQDPVGGAASHVLFASEIAALQSLRERAEPAEPDVAVLSAYLSTIRTSMGSRTMMQGVCTLQPGEVRVWAVGHGLGKPRARELWHAPARAAIPLREAVAATQRVLQESVLAHSHADVPLCCMLSGGLDSTILAGVLLQGGDGAAARTPALLNTYCVRAENNTQGAPPQDADFAAELASSLGTSHRQVSIDGDGFLVRWAAMVSAMGTPLSTPNETAIFEVLRLAREQGQRVALSGEGADELFGGYTLVLAGLERAMQGAALDAASHARIAIENAAWMGEAIKPQVLLAKAWNDLDHDAALHTWARQEFSQLLALGDSEPLGVQLRWQRRVNLAGLLQRFDTASMLASVEGRTPFADVRVASLAESLPMHTLYNGTQGKLALRAAFAHAVPQAIAARAKASFPLPFQAWMQPLATLIQGSPLLRSLVREPVLALASQRAQEHWNLAWPLANIALWEQRWWPDGAALPSYAAHSARAI